MSREAAQYKPRSHPLKEKVVFVGGGIVSLVSVITFIETVIKNGTFDNYIITVIEQEDDVAQGTTFANGGHLTATGGFSPLTLGGGNVTKLHKAISEDTSSDGWLGIEPSKMTAAQKKWCALTYKFSRKENVAGYHAAKHAIATLGKRSVTLTKEFFDRFPKLAEHSSYHYFDGQETHLMRIHNTRESYDLNYEYFKSLGIRVTKLDFQGVCAQEPILLRANDNLVKNIQQLGAIGMEGSCINANAFTKALKDLLEKKYGVNFQFNSKATNIKSNHGMVEGVTIEHDGKPEFIEADKLLISTGYDTSLFKEMGINIPIEPINGCTLTVPIGADIQDFPTAPLNRVTPDGSIVFFPHGPKDRPSALRVGGCYWYSPGDRGISSAPALSGINMLKAHLKEMYPEIYAEAQRHDTFSAWVGCRPCTPDNVPIIDQIRLPESKKDSGIFINMGHGPGGTSYSFASAEIVTEKMLGREAKIEGVDILAFSLDRFRPHRLYCAKL